MNNNQLPTTSKDDSFLKPNTFYLNKQPYSSNSLKSTFSDTNREPLNYNILQDRYATHEKVKRPDTANKLINKVRSSLICCPTSEEVSNHRKSLSIIEVNINETKSEITLSKINKDEDTQSANYGCSAKKVASSVMSLFPIFESLKNYDMKNDFIKDLFAGITIAVLHIPQGMAYGLLAGVGAINGLYVSFFPVLVYGFLGTSRHVSVGTFAVVSIMLYNAANKLNAFDHNGDTSTDLPFNLTTSSYTTSMLSSRHSTDLPPTPLEVLTSLSLLIGLIMIIMGVLNLGVLSLVLSDQLITSFSSGAAIHVATSQVAAVFGIPSFKSAGHFKLVYSWIDLFKHYNQINLPTLTISVCVFLVLIIFKEFLELPIRKKFKIDFQIPIDLLVIIIVTAIGYKLNWDTRFKVSIMGEIPTGIPSPKLPRTDLFAEIIYDALAITMVIFALLISLAKLYATKFNYKISPNHELIALGSANLVGSFFLCFPSSASLSRSSVQERTGAKTQLVGIISSVIVLTILLYLGPLFYFLPKGLFMQIGELKRTWRTSRSEGLVWFVTFTATVLLDVDLGLVIGIIFSLCMTLLQFTMPSTTLLGQVPFTEVYVDSEIYSKAIQLRGIRIFQFSCPLFFLNKDYFKEMLFTKTLQMPFEELSKRCDLSINRQNAIDQLQLDKNDDDDLNAIGDDEATNSLSNTNYAYIDDNQQTITSTRNSTSSFNTNSQINQQTITSGNQIRINHPFSRNSSTNHLFTHIYEADNGDEKTIHTVIIDCSGISTADSAGVRCLEEVIKDFSKIKLHCYLANCPSPLLLMLRRMKFIDKLPCNSGIFATIHDSVLHAFNRTNQLQQFIIPLNENSPNYLNNRSNSLQPTRSFNAKECSYDLINEGVVNN